MEASDSPADVKLDVKQKAAELGRQRFGHRVYYPGQQPQPAGAAECQPQAVNNDSKPTTDISARRDPQHLPTAVGQSETPAQLHQKVNLMLTDKLQQAEIQLDPWVLAR